MKDKEIEKAKMPTRKRTVNRLKDSFKITITPIPKVRIKVTFRPDGSWFCDFGYKSFKHLVDTNQYWDENGNYKYKGHHSFWGGQDYVINDMWKYIRNRAYYGKIHHLDLAVDKYSILNIKEEIK